MSIYRSLCLLLALLLPAVGHAGLTASDCTPGNFGAQSDDKFCTGTGRAWFLTGGDRFQEDPSVAMGIEYDGDVELNLRIEAPNPDGIEAIEIVSLQRFERPFDFPGETTGSIGVATGDNPLSFESGGLLDTLLEWQARDGFVVVLERVDAGQTFFGLELIRTVAKQDWGDAPVGGGFNYPVMEIGNGARHDIITQFSLFSVNNAQDREPDFEVDGQPSVFADADDSDGTNDEQGWLLPSMPAMFTPFQILYARATHEIEIAADVRGVANQNAFLQGFFDTDHSGDWGPGEKLIDDFVLSQGINKVSIDIPDIPAPGFTYARFRMSTQAGLDQDGPAPDGEVEDHSFLLTDTDFSDAPDSYNVVAPPTHDILPGLMLGKLVDGEDGPLPSPRADGDDLARAADDEDGLLDLRPTSLVGLPGRMNFVFPGEPAQMQIRIGGNTDGLLSVWIDADAIPEFDFLTETVISATPVVAGGVFTLNFFVPAEADLGPTMARLRLEDQVFRVPTPFGLPPGGYGGFGEVEDHEIFVAFGLDWGDAPESYGTLSDDLGPRHAILVDFGLGERNDADLDGRPSTLADGDDANGQEDEDGVLFRGLDENILRTNRNDHVIVSTANLQPGELHAWVDANRDGDFLDPGEKVVDALAIDELVTEVEIDVPDDIAVSGPSIMRFRYIKPPQPTDPPLEPIDDENSVLHVGEVEDHPVTLYYEVFAGGFEEE